MRVDFNESTGTIAINFAHVLPSEVSELISRLKLNVSFGVRNRLIEITLFGTDKYQLSDKLKYVSKCRQASYDENSNSLRIVWSETAKIKLL